LFRFFLDVSDGNIIKDYLNIILEILMQALESVAVSATRFLMTGCLDLNPGSSWSTR